jgi:hypothetical protein
MRIVCDKCGFIIDRDKCIDKIKVEEYSNLYGTYCNQCGNFIKPLEKIKIVKKNELKIEMLRNEMREKLKKRIKGDN